MATPHPKLICEVEEGPPGSRTKRVLVVESEFMYFGRSASHLEEVSKRELKSKGSPAGTVVKGVDYEVLSSDVVSSIHCKIWYDAAAKKFYVTDCRSRNGTWLAPPASQESMRDYMFLGDKASKSEKAPLSIMSAVKAANVIILVTNIEGTDSSSTKHDLSDAFNYTDGGTVTEDVSKQDMVIQVVSGPGAGQNHVLKYGESCAVGRSAPGSSVPRPGGRGAAGPTKRIAIHTKSKFLSRNHVVIYHATEMSAARPIVVQALSKNGASFCRQPNFSCLLSFDTLEWQLVQYSQSVRLSFGDLVRCGKDTILLLIDHAGPPQRLAPPVCQGVTSSTISLSWESAISPTAVKGYILAMASGPRVSDPQPAQFAQILNQQEQAASGDGLEYALVSEAELDLPFSNEYGGGQLQTTVGPLDPERVYFFRLQARNAGGESAWSAVVAFATIRTGGVGNGSPPDYVDAALQIHNRTTGAFTASDVHGGEDTDDDEDFQASLATHASGSGSGSAAVSHTTHGLNNDAPIRWKKGNIIGLGAQGKVYFARDRDNGTVMAVKEIECMEESMAESQLANIEEEIAILGELDHPNIVKYIGMNKTVEHGRITLHLFLEYVAGGSLRSFIKKTDTSGLEESAAQMYTFQILQGLSYLHRKGIVHRDIKTANILLAIFGNQQVCKIADFGASKALSGDFRSLVGTPNFMAPEVIRQRGSFKSDVWSVGCTVYEMLTGTPPWAEVKETAAIMFLVADKGCAPEFPSRISPELVEFVSRCFVADPEARASVDELLALPWMTAVGVSMPAPASPVSRPSFSPLSSPLTPAAPSTAVESDADTEVSSSTNVTTPSSLSERRSGKAVAVDATSSQTLDPAAAGSSDAPSSPSSFQNNSHVIPWSELNLHEDIGKGGYGAVVRAEYLGLDVAVKFLTKVENINEFMSEASVLADIRHPNCVLYMGVTSNESEKRYGIVMEYLEGGDLHSAIHAPPSGRSLGLATRVRILSEVASGLVYLHSHRTVHRDIKLRNILLDRSHQAKLADFGLSTAQSDQKTAATIRYAAPEVLSGQRLADMVSDVYSFGLVMFEVLTGTKPFAQLRDAKDRYNDLTLEPGNPPRDPRVAPLVPVMVAAWAFDRAQRPTMKFILSAIKDVLAALEGSSASAARAPVSSWLTMFDDDTDDESSTSARGTTPTAATPGGGTSTSTSTVPLPIAPYADNDDDTATQGI